MIKVGGIYRTTTNKRKGKNDYIINIAQNGGKMFYFILENISVNSNDGINAAIQEFKQSHHNFTYDEFSYCDVTQVRQDFFDGYLGQVDDENLKYLKDNFSETDIFNQIVIFIM